MLVSEIQFAEIVRQLNPIIRIDSLRRNDGKIIVDFSPKSDSPLDSIVCSAVFRTIAAFDCGK